MYGIIEWTPDIIFYDLEVILKKSWLYYNLSKAESRYLPVLFVIQMTWIPFPVLKLRHWLHCKRRQGCQEYRNCIDKIIRVRTPAQEHLIRYRKFYHVVNLTLCPWWFPGGRSPVFWRFSTPHLKPFLRAAINCLARLLKLPACS